MYLFSLSVYGTINNTNSRLLAILLMTWTSRSWCSAGIKWAASNMTNRGSGKQARYACDETVSKNERQTQI